VDFSAPLRQGIIAAVNHPLMAWKAQKASFRAWFNKSSFDNWFHEVKANPRYEIATKGAGLDLSDPHSIHLKAQEEAFMGNIVEAIPGLGDIKTKSGKNIAGLISGSERAYVMFLDKMRWDLFNRYADMFEENGRTFENSPELYKGLASYVNNATGRGNINLGFMQSSAPVLNAFLFSPRLIASRLNMLGLGDIASAGHGFYGKLPPEIRKMAAMDMIKFVAAGVGVLALARYGFGADVETDPRSTDFGKIKLGNTRWDIWGGFQPYVRLVAQMISGQKKSSTTGDIQDLNGQGAFGETRGSELGRFARGKLAPVPAMAFDFLTGRQASGDKTTLLQEISDHFTPLLYSDIHDAWQDQGAKALFTAGIPSIFGVGVQTYQPRPQSGRGGNYGGGGSSTSY